MKNEPCKALQSGLHRKIPLPFLVLNFEVLPKISKSYNSLQVSTYQDHTKSGDLTDHSIVPLFPVHSMNSV